MARDRLVERLVAWSYAAAITAGLLLIATTLVNALLLDGRAESLDGRVEASIWTWASSSATAAAAIAALVHAIFFPSARVRWTTLGLILAFFSLDDSMRIHETIGNRVRVTLDLPSYTGGMWLLVYLPLLAVVVWALFQTAREHAGSVRRAVLAGLALLAAAVVLEAIGIPTKRLAEDSITWPHAGRGILEEATELAGLVLLAGALGSALVASIGDAARRF